MVRLDDVDRRDQLPERARRAEPDVLPGRLDAGLGRYVPQLRLDRGVGSRTRLRSRRHSAAVRTSSTPASTCNRTAITRRWSWNAVFPEAIAARDVDRFLPARVDVHLIDEPRRFLMRATTSSGGRAERRSEQYHDDRRLEGRRELHSGQLADHDGAVRDELQHRTGQPIRDRGRHRLERAMEQSKPARRAADVALDHEQRRFAAHAGARFRRFVLWRLVAVDQGISPRRDQRPCRSTRRIFRSMRYTYADVYKLPAAGPSHLNNTMS